MREKNVNKEYVYVLHGYEVHLALKDEQRHK